MIFCQLLKLQAYCYICRLKSDNNRFDSCDECVKSFSEFRGTVVTWWTESCTESAELRVELGFDAYVVSYRCLQCVSLRPVHPTRLVPRMSRRRQDAPAQSTSRRGNAAVHHAIFTICNTAIPCRGEARTLLLGGGLEPRSWRVREREPI